MMKKTAAVVLILSLVPVARGQLKTYLNVETGPRWSMLRVVDPGDYFKGANVNTTLAGVTFSQEFLENLFVTTGVYYIPSRAGINMEDDRGFQSSWRSHTTWLIPVRFEYRIQPSEFPVSFTPRLGYVYHLVNMPADPYSASSVLIAPDYSAFTYSLEQSADPPGNHLIETGVSLGLRLHGLWQASLSVAYLSGLGQSGSIGLTYTDQDFNTREAEYRYKGNAIHTTLAFQLPVSNIWQNRDYRIRSRVERSAGEGKPTDRKGEFYLGAEGGSLWRLFSSTNPAVGPRPMDHQGMFRYANLHAGIHAGYMLTAELGIDLGVTYQRSSTFYSLMYDHNVNFETRSPAPLFLEVPLRLRYLYNLHKEKIHFGVYGGISMLTHFAEEGYGTGEGSFTYLSPETASPTPATTSYTASRTTRFRPVLRVGTGFEYRLPLEFPLIATLYAGYYHGYISIENIEVTTSIPETPAVSSVTYRGSGWSIDLGVKVPFRFGQGGICAPLPEREKMP
ncbi:MAG: hypothetical protein R6U78_02935 [Bacteroidales bacterium]